MKSSNSRKTKSGLFILAGFGVIVVSFFTLIFFWWRGASSSPAKSDESVRFVITKGSGASQIAANLEEENLIKSSLAFKFYVQLIGKSDKILAGEYSLSSNLELKEIVEVLLRGPEEIWITIPEGLRKEEVAAKLASGLGLEGEAYQLFVNDFYNESSNLEGKLFPDTYLFAKDITVQKAVAHMNQVFETKFAQALSEKNTYLSNAEILVLASLIEREAFGLEERPVIAGILINRLDADWPLQVDATLQYQEGIKKCSIDKPKCDWWPTVTKQSIDTPSSFNTYKNLGLPPTPISNPGLTSLKAAANPQKSDYWFYLHDSNGEIHYAETIEIHNANVAEYLGK